MPNTREKLIEVLRKTRYEYRRYIAMKDYEKRMAKTDEEFLAVDDSIVGEIPFCADHLIANGVTFATDNNVGDKLTPTEPLTNCQHWIPVTERLPDKPGRYLICEEFGRVMIAGWDTSCWFGGHSYSEFTVYKATHWIPLPEPPKGE